MMISKICKTCGVDKSDSEYYPHKSTKDRLDQHCKSCKKTASKLWAEKNKDKRKKISKKYVKNNPEKRSETIRNYYLKNKKEIRIRIKKSIEKKPEPYAELGRKHANIRRARKLNNGQEAYTESQVLSTYGTNCHICDTPIKLKAPRKVGVKGWELGLHLDHVVPLAKGGPDSLENVKPAHGKCNLQKNSMA
jgi:5-methylcytosine-specific restriction endonuclease McrA